MLDPKTAKEMHDQACRDSGMPDSPNADYCTMCGKEWCSVRINKEIREYNRKCPDKA